MRLVSVPYSVGWNNISGDGAEQLAKVVLEHTSLTDFCCIPLVSLRENSITDLNLFGKGVGVPGAIVLSSLLPSAMALKALNLRENNLDAEAARYLGEGLKINGSLRELNVTGNALKAEGARHIADMLAVNQTLTSVDLRYNGQGAALDDAAKEQLRSAAGDRVKL